MENQQPSPQPIQPVQTPAPSPKTAFPWRIVVLVIVVIALSVGITLFLVKGSSLPFLSKTKPTSTVVKNPQPIEPIANTTTPTTEISPNSTLPTNMAVSPTSTSSCEVSDNAFCNVLADLKLALSANNYAGFLAYHNLQSVTCDPDGMFIAICEGVAKGVVKQGYGIGYNQSEETVAAKEGYVTSVSAYVKTNGPFTYRGSLVSGDKGVAVFLNITKDHILVFPMKRSGSTWRMDHLLLGGTFGDNSFDSLSDSLLNFVQ